MSNPSPVQVGYDAVYSALPKSPTFLRIWREHAIGADFPDEFAHISFVTLDQLRSMTLDLRLSPGETLVDLGCGLAGPSLWVARETGAKLIGVDLSPEAVSGATARAKVLGLDSQATFQVGTFDSTHLPDGTADAAMSEDALQYAPNKQAGMNEAARILKPGGRLVFSVFELDPPSVEGLPILGTDPVDDYRSLLETAGFMIDSYETAPGWPEPMRGSYSAVLAARGVLAKEMGEPAVAALSSEMALTLERNPYLRRVMVVATKE